MSSEWNPPTQCRVLDVGAPDEVLATELAARGNEHYLALVDADRLPQVRAELGDHASSFHPLEDITILQRSSADLLILRADFARVAWGWGELAHFRWLAIERDSSGGPWEAKLAMRLASSRGRVTPRGVWRVPGAGNFDLFEVDRVVEREARIYFSPRWGVEGLAQRLAAAGISYAVLRWFETLPVIEPGEDLDILVSDADVERFRALVESEPGTMPIDLYSVSGLDGSDFRDAAYYVPHLAEQILANAVVHHSGMRVPAPEDHLHSLAYHAVYHKGVSSGLPSALIDTDAAPEHDYAEAIGAIAQQCGRSVSVALEDLDEYLESVGWRPPADALRRLAGENTWLERRLDASTGSTASNDAQLAVFLVRESTLDVLGEEEIAAVFSRWGFEFVVSQMLDEKVRADAARALRGGNWGRGPYPVSGGRPAMILAGIHYAPGAVSEALAQRYPHLTNADVYFVKQEMRDLIESRVGVDRAFNAVHSADDEHEAWHYLEVVAPTDVDYVASERDRRAASQVAAADVIATLSRGRRARVDVVETAGGRAVRKTYTEGAQRYREREVHAMDALAKAVPAVPAVRERGDAWFTMELFDDQLASVSRPLPLPVLRGMVDVLRAVRAHGFVLVDAKPDNFVLDRSGLRVIDLEFAYPADEDAPPLERGPEFVEPDRTVYPDVPAGDSSYETRWLPHTGLPLAVLLHGTPAAQRIHRARYVLRKLTVAPGSPLRARLRGIRSMVTTAKARLRATVNRRAWGAGRRAPAEGSADAEQ